MKSEQINEITNPVKIGESPSTEKIERKHINIRGRVEHERYLFDPKKCKELGLDIIFERIVYMKRWGSLLNGRTDFNI